jgi:hypothetical protein
MNNQTIISIGLGLLGAVILLGPRVYDAAKSILARRPSQPVQPSAPEGHLVLDLSDPHLETVVQLSALVSLRAHLAGDPKAQEVIDTVLAPSVLQASEGSSDESN